MENFHAKPTKDVYEKRIDQSIWSGASRIRLSCGSKDDWWRSVRDANDADSMTDKTSLVNGYPVIGTGRWPACPPVRRKLFSLLWMDRSNFRSMTKWFALSLESCQIRELGNMRDFKLILWCWSGCIRNVVNSKDCSIRCCKLFPSSSKSIWCFGAMAKR